MEKLARANKYSASDRGPTNLGWLESHHTFSFGHFRNPDRMGYRSLRVLNDDRVAPKGGFPPHPHRDMEIFSYVLSGALAHQDSMGNQRELRRGDLQLMSAGSGVTHSEFNPSSSEPTHFLQIWIEPSVLGAPPRYDEQHFSDDQKRATWVLMLSPDGRDGSVEIRQDARVYSTILEDTARIVRLEEGRYGFLHVADGEVFFEGDRLLAGDSLAFEGPAEFEIRAAGYGEVLFFDLA